VYVLTDNRFRHLARLAGAPAGPETEAVVQRTLHFPCGLIRGALAALGVSAVVTAEPGTLPACAQRRTALLLADAACAGSFTLRVKTPTAPPLTPPA
jgi:hypothetical protein